MLSTSVRNQILSLFSELTITTNYPAIILFYKILCSIIKEVPSLNPLEIAKFIKSPEFCDALARHSQNSITKFFSNPVHFQQISNLSWIVQRNNLHINYSGFFLSLAPSLVADWDHFLKIGIPDTAVLDSLMQLYKDTASLVGSPAIFSHVPYTYSNSIRKILPKTDNQFIEAFWNATFRTRCKAPEYKYTRVDKAIRIYAALGKSKETLLADYLLEFRDMNQQPICFRDLSPSNQQKVNPTKHLDETNVTYHVAGKYLALDFPATVLDRLYYQEFSDPLVDCTLLIDQFLARIRSSRSPLIINPSPQFLSLLEKKAPKASGLTIIVPSRQMALAFSIQFQDWAFVSAEDWLPASDSVKTQRDPLGTDLVLLLCPTGSSKRPKLSHLMRCFTPMTNCEFIAYAPEYLFIGKQSSFLPDLKQKLMQVNQIIEVTQALIFSGSKRKLILIANSCTPEEAQRNVNVPIYQCLTDSSGRWVSIAPESKWQDLISMWRNHSVGKRPQQHKPVTRTRKPASLLHWSQEIVIAYSVYPEDTESPESGLRARAYIQRLDDIDKDSSQRINGIPNKSSSAVYLRAETEEELMVKIWNIPFHQKVHKAIMQDVIRVYDHRPEELTIKTTWLCVRDFLLRTNYNDELAQELFCGPNQIISNLCFSASFDDFASAFQSTLGSEHIPIKYWTLLRQIVELAMKHGFFQENPLDQYAPIIEAQGRQKVYSIQDSIRQWCFSPAEMDRMIDPLILPDESSAEQFRPYVRNSHSLLKLVASFSLASKAELIALDYCDLIDLPNGGIQALITKYVNSNGQIVEYDSSTAERRKRRKVAFPPFIAYCYHERVSWLKDKTKDKEIQERSIPIFLEDEPKRYFRTTMKRCSLKTATKLYSELVQSADVPKRQLTLLEGKDQKVIDLELPRKTENLFRNQIIISGSRYGLEDGELSYAAGTMPEATIDSHYIGYDAPQNQIATSAKLHRLSAKYYGRIENRKSVATRHAQLISAQTHHLKMEPSVDRRISAMLELISGNPNHTPKFRISLRSSFSHRITITSFSQEVQND